MAFHPFPGQGVKHGDPSARGGTANRAAPGRVRLGDVGRRISLQREMALYDALPATLDSVLLVLAQFDELVMDAGQLRT